MRLLEQLLWGAVTQGGGYALPWANMHRPFRPKILATFLPSCFEVKSEKLSQVAVGLSWPETVTPPAQCCCASGIKRFADRLRRCEEWGRIPDGMRGTTIGMRFLPSDASLTGCFARHVTSSLRDALHATLPPILSRPVGAVFFCTRPYPQLTLGVIEIASFQDAFRATFVLPTSCP